MQRVFVVHGWGESPEAGWFPWIKAELVKEGFEPHVLEMPTPAWPQIDSWVSFLSAAVRKSDTKTILVGHSVGCQTILRYLEKLPAGAKVGGIVLIAGWLTLKPAALEDEDTKAIADPWLHRPMSWVKIKPHLERAAIIASDDDPYVPMEDQHVFHQHLGAPVTIVRGQGHLGAEDGLNQLPSALKAILDIAKRD